MIVEGLLTSTDSAGTINVAPMGPIVHGDFETFTLRPFAGSTTFENLQAQKCGVFHVVDRVNVIAEAAIRRLKDIPATVPASKVNGFVLQDCCRWFEFKITDIDTSEQRSVMTANVIHTGNRRPFHGFNRARHAVIEAAILATRVHLLPAADVQTQLGFLQSAVEKTGGAEEAAAFTMLVEHIQQHYAGAAVA